MEWSGTARRGKKGVSEEEEEERERERLVSRMCVELRRQPYRRFSAVARFTLFCEVGADKK